jgi:hypothetical protein
MHLDIPFESTIRFRVSSFAGRGNVRPIVTVEASPLDPKISTFLLHNNVPLRFTDEDFDQLASGAAVTKVLYLPDDLSSAGEDLVETTVSSRLEPGLDPVAEAKKRGTVIAVVRMAMRAELTPAKPPAEKPGNDPSAKRSDDPFGK